MAQVLATVTEPQAYVPPKRDDSGRARSQTMRSVTLKISGGTDVIELPCYLSTTVEQMKEYIAGEALTEADRLDFFVKRGPYTTKLKEHEQLPSVTIVKGIKKFAPEKKKWPHPIGIIGQGYHGQKTAMSYIMDNDSNFVCFDRNNQWGGYCWTTGANKTSRLQTEFGSFHIWYGPQGIDAGYMDYPSCAKGGWHIWPYKAEILKHFNEAGAKYGLAPHVHFQVNVSKMDIIGDKKAEDRYYLLQLDNLKEGGEKIPDVPVSIIWCYPGSLTQNRIIEYPGEELFDGAIRYGMNDDTPYDKLKGANVAILGNGAFAVENARTVLECEGLKSYIVTRRKNLASPRMPCWFVHQGPLPTPGRMILSMFKPMYDLADFGDPWKYWSVHADATRTNVTILQNSRFGIGDVTFLMCIWGLLVYVVGTVKRFSRHTLHISNGEKLENVTVCLKALGLLGDWSVDKLHGMKEMKGAYCDGDWRRCLMIDATGMNAANFTTFSTGIGTTDFVLCNKYLYDFPQEFYKIESQGFVKNLPSHKEEPEFEKPAYVTDVKYSMTSGIILDTMVPKIANMKLRGRIPAYKYTMYHKCHSFDRTLEVAKEEWDAYQATWKARGVEHEYTPYPYTKEMASEWFKEWSTNFKIEQVPIVPDGPGPDGWKVPGVIVGVDGSA
jgi:hypothetical protein